jgi:hypothetical protein
LEQNLNVSEAEDDVAYSWIFRLNSAIDKFVKKCWKAAQNTRLKINSKIS